MTSRASSFRLRNDLYCVGWGVKLYSLTHSLAQVAGGNRQEFAQRGKEGEGTCTERTVRFHYDWLKNIRVGEARIFRLYDWQRGQLRRRQTEQKTTNMKLPVCSPR